MCQALKTQPVSGGVLEQDSLFMHYLGYILEYDAARAELDQKQK
jgi:hypothetical protein